MLVKGITTPESKMEKLEAQGKEVVKITVATKDDNNRIAGGYHGFKDILEIGEPTEQYGKSCGFIRYPQVRFAPKKKES